LAIRIKDNWLKISKGSIYTPHPGESQYTKRPCLTEQIPICNMAHQRSKSVDDAYHWIL